MEASRRYSFMSAPMEALLSSTGHLLPGCAMAQAHFFDSPTGKLVSLLCAGDTIEPMELEAPYKTRIQKLRSGRTGWHWLHDQQLSIVESVLMKPQLTLDDEQHNRLLLICLPGDDGMNDLLVLSLSNEWRDFGPAMAGDSLRTGDKSVIGKLLYRTFAYLHKLHIKDRQIHEKLSRMMTHRKEQLLADKNRAGQHLRMHLDLVRSFIEQRLDLASEQEGVHFEVTKEAVEKVSDFGGTIEQLESIVESALITALNTAPTHVDHIVVDESHIVFSDEHASAAIHHPGDRYEKTKLFLNRYEEAARCLTERGKKVTGSNIGKYCTPPCSPAAISDVLKNHRKKMMTLFRKHPELWPVLRSHFRPVANICENLNAS